MRRLWTLWRMIRWGRRSDRSGLTVACDPAQCTEPDPHDAHLAPGALRYLSSAK
jgi:hypothetical protein